MINREKKMVHISWVVAGFVFGGMVGVLAMSIVAMSIVAIGARHDD